MYYITYDNTQSHYFNLTNLTPMRNSLNYLGHPILGKIEGQIIYPWQSVTPHSFIRGYLWLGYLSHQLIQFIFIFKLMKLTKFKDKQNNQSLINYYNNRMKFINFFFICMKFYLNIKYYDGLAIDLHEIIALFSVTLILIIIVILKSNERGLILSYKPTTLSWLNFKQFVFQIHSYLCSFGSILNFWYHPIGCNIAFLIGYYYQLILIYQTSTSFTQQHNSNLILLELLVILHSTTTSLFQSKMNFQLFYFGYLCLFLINYSYAECYQKYLGKYWKSILIGMNIILFYFVGNIEKFHTIFYIPSSIYLLVIAAYIGFCLIKGTI
ncbi:hypothetical protein K502DRAFT_348867 [Neoconidiobolus thromboides FSU 785]|nr:hypothetical protein K502DRAFT_348867 [Neoconidiobolus thromboides FSU 785]